MIAEKYAKQLRTEDAYLTKPVILILRHVQNNVKQCMHQRLKTLLWG